MRNPKDFAETELVRYSGANLGVDPKKEKKKWDREETKAAR
jgi:hypothetical protein